MWSSAILGDSGPGRMQSEETSAESLENLPYPGQHQPSGVLNINEQGAHFGEAMGTDVHGLKRPPESDDDREDAVSEDIKPKKKTRGRVKIEMKFITNKLRRYTTFSKRKTGIMKKVCIHFDTPSQAQSLYSYVFTFFFQAYELSTLTGTQVMLLVASETGHVYTFATRKLQPMITSESGKALIQTCLNSPDLPVTQIPNTDQRMSATGYEETDLTYTVGENDTDKVCNLPSGFERWRRGFIFSVSDIEFGGAHGATMSQNIIPQGMPLYLGVFPYYWSDGIGCVSQYQRIENYRCRNAFWSIINMLPLFKKHIWEDADVHTAW